VQKKILASAEYGGEIVLLKNGEVALLPQT
jgi:hypothetical protein